MFQGLRTVIYPVSDIEQAKAWYTAILGQEPYFDQPYYVGYTVGGYELGLDPNAKRPQSDGAGPTTYWGVANIEEVLARLRSLGAVERAALQDVGEGIRVATVADPYGNSIGIIENPHFSLANAR
jgi:predicted enzyme related to lactoylglutathione lyase